MKPWREQGPGALERQAAELLARGASLQPWGAQQRLAILRRLRIASADEPSSVWRAGWAFPLALCGSLALLAFVVVHSRARPAPQTSVARATPATPPASPAAGDGRGDEWAEVDLGRSGHLRVARDSIYRLSQAPGDERASLDQGKLCAEIAHRDLARQRPYLVEMPDSQAVVIGTRFCVEVSNGVSTLSVSEGRVQLRTASGSAFVNAGESLSSHDPRLLQPAAAMAPSTAPRPGIVSHPARALAQARIEPAALPSHPPPQPSPSLRDGEGEQRLPAPAPTISPLAEQNALYARAIAARDANDGPAALAAWRAYLQRFPQGVLAAEASTGALSELVREGRTGEALRTATDYLARFPADGRAADVAFLRGDLLREKETTRALFAYRQAYELADRPRLRDEALFAIAACEQRLGQSAETTATLRRYRAEFPSGAHASEVSKWLAP